VSLTIEAELAPLRIDQDGVVRVGETRVTLDTVIETFGEGASAEEIVEQYPSVKLGDVYAVIAYYLRHRPEVDAYLDGRRSDAERVRREYEERFPREPGFRDRLMAKRL
jgi:uncharacterized protein (DUF433 family)